MERPQAYARDVQVGDLIRVGDVLPALLVDLIEAAQAMNTDGTGNDEYRVVGTITIAGRDIGVELTLPQDMPCAWEGF